MFHCPWSGAGGLPRTPRARAWCRWGSGECESILQQLMSELELESSALDQEIVNVARLLLGLAEHGF